jgi:hypothetical protein
LIAALAALGGCGAGALTGDAGGMGPATCAATCGTPAGAGYLFRSTAEGATAMTGLWQFCGVNRDTFPDLPADAVGVEFGPPESPVNGGRGGGGNLYYLVTSSAGPIRGAGIAYQLTYEVVPYDGAYQLDVHPTPDVTASSALRYSPCPREFEFGAYSSGLSTLLVPF